MQVSLIVELFFSNTFLSRLQKISNEWLNNDEETELTASDFGKLR